jgi:HME family heavy-metal exporter
MRRTGLLLLLTWAAVGLSTWLMTRLGADFLPAFDEGVVQVGLTLPSGSSLGASNRAAVAVDAKLRSMQRTEQNLGGEILRFVRRTGRAELEEHAEPPNTSEYILSVNPGAGRSREEVIRQLLDELKAAAPGADLEVEQPLAHLISHMLSGVSAQIAVKIYGDDLDTLRRLAEQVKAAAATVEGVSPPVVEPVREVEELHVRLRPEALEFYGVDRAAVARFVQTSLQGAVVSQVLEGQRRFDLLVRLEEPHRTDYAQLGRLRFDLPGGRGQVAPGELAEIGPGLGANQVKRDNARRRIVVRCNALGRDLASVVGDIQARVRERVSMPEGYYPEYGGQFESQTRATRLIGALAAVAGVGMFVVLY